MKTREVPTDTRVFQNRSGTGARDEGPEIKYQLVVNPDSLPTCFHSTLYNKHTSFSCRLRTRLQHQVHVTVILVTVTDSERCTFRHIYILIPHTYIYRYIFTYVAVLYSHVTPPHHYFYSVLFFHNDLHCHRRWWNQWTGINTFAYLHFLISASLFVFPSLNSVSADVCISSHLIK